jgi:hypothetical protein
MVAHSKAGVEAAARSEVGVEAATRSELMDEAAVCSRLGIEDGRRQGHDDV